MKEEILHYLWKTKRIGPIGLTGTKGEQIEILNYGFHNTASGPDFLEASVQIDNVTWFGHIEIHYKSSDWKKHKHSLDKKYRNVILHVVFEDDVHIIPFKNVQFTCLAINRLISAQKIYQIYSSLAHSRSLPCQKHLSEINRILWLDIKDRMCIERLERRHHELERLHRNFGNDFEQTCLMWLTQYFGSRSNKEALRSLATRLNWKIIFNIAGKANQVESYILGLAGFLEVRESGHQAILYDVFQFLKDKYHLNPIRIKWNYLRIRPVGFPEFRLAQMAAMMDQFRQLFSRIKDSENVAQLAALFQVPTSDYWKKHYRFGLASKPRNLVPGKVFIYHMIINAILPLLYFYGRKTANQAVQSKAIRFLEEIPPESNNISRLWQSHGVRIENAFDSQALIQLKHEHCDKKKCFSCAIGHKVLSSVAIQ